MRRDHLAWRFVSYAVSYRPCSLKAGVEVNVIRGWLGHVSLETTNRYAEITVRTKEGERKPAWRDDQALLTWLAAL
jgi:integrase/recombinase XerD